MKSGHIIFYIITFAVVGLVAPMIGAESLDLSSVMAFLGGESSSDGQIFFYQRVPRVLLSLLAGGTLAVVGAAFQAVFRNPLVEPYTLGITGGAALGAFLAVLFPALWFSIGPVTSAQFLAILGAGMVLFFIYRFSRLPQGVSITNVLLAGVTISIVCAGAILFLTYIASPNNLLLFQRWMMGGVDVVGFREVSFLLPFMVPGVGVLFFRAVDLNHLSLGSDMAMGHGVDVPRVRSEVFLGGGIATAAVVSLVGPIGFIGLIVPHAVRRISGFDQRIVLPASFLLGGSALAVCDCFARTVIAPTELPVGIITAVVGGPMFIRLLLKVGK